MPLAILAMLVLVLVHANCVVTVLWTAPNNVTVIIPPAPIVTVTKDFIPPEHQIARLAQRFLIAPPEPRALRPPIKFVQLAMLAMLVLVLVHANCAVTVLWTAAKNVTVLATTRVRIVPVTTDISPLGIRNVKFVLLS